MSYLTCASLAVFALEERERAHHSLVRKGNDSMYFLECEPESRNTFLLGSTVCWALYKGLGLQQGRDFPAFAKLTL